MSKRNRNKEKQHLGSKVTSPTASSVSHGKDYFRRHLLLGWWSLLLFLTLGLVLEAMHGFKVQWYVGEDNVTRRLMFTLGHAHGTLLSLIHIAFAFSARALRRTGSVSAASSWCLTLAGFLLPIGFLAGGLHTYHGDPGLGILIVPIGGLFLVIGVLMTALSMHRLSLGTEGSADSE